MSVAEVKNLCKTYPGFELKDVSFNLNKGRITGFIQTSMRLNSVSDTLQALSITTRGKKSEIFYPLLKLFIRRGTKIAAENI